MNTSVRIETGVDGPQVGEMGAVEEKGGGEERESRC